MCEGDFGLSCPGCANAPKACRYLISSVRPFGYQMRTNSTVHWSDTAIQKRLWNFFHCLLIAVVMLWWLIGTRSFLRILSLISLNTFNRIHVWRVFCPFERFDVTYLRSSTTFERWGKALHPSKHNLEAMGCAICNFFSYWKSHINFITINYGRGVRLPR